MNNFTEEYPSIESYFRSLFLFGKNSASYKFALAKSLFELSAKQKNNTFISLDEVSIPFAKNVCDHLLLNDKQTTSNSSEFLNICRRYNRGEATFETLIANTKNLGFVNVLDAFHNINRNSIPVAFFEVTKESGQKGIILTDNLFKLNESVQYSNFNQEIEARWRLVETAWSLNFNPALLDVKYDIEKEIFYIDEHANLKRIDITSSRPALNGYQKGKCFYCFNDISIDKYSVQLADVDHFFPHALKKETQHNIDGVWNLVLACTTCNRGAGGKFMAIPQLRFLERLHRRNEFFIGSHHPLRETLIKQTGATEKMRIAFLQQMYSFSIRLYGDVKWQPIYEYEPAF